MRNMKAFTFVAILALTVVVLSLQAGGLASEDASAASGGAPEMTLTITEGGFCAGSDCYAAKSSNFKLSVVLDNPPASGYTLMQTAIDYGDFDPTASEDGAGPNTCSDSIDNGAGDGADRFDDDCVTLDLTYIPAPAAIDEIVWDDVDPGIALRDSWVSGVRINGGMTALFPPLPVSSFEGAVVTLEFSCPAVAANVPVSILPYDDPLAGSSGAGLRDGSATNLFVTPKVDTITLHCVGKQWPPGDTDGDGCRDVRENNANPAVGGDRGWLNPWDFYDVNFDGVIDLTNDIFGVINHYSPSGGPPYDVLYDRGAWGGPDSWSDTAPPDGVIDLANDINGVIAQYNHNCT